MRNRTMLAGIALAIVCLALGWPARLLRADEPAEQGEQDPGRRAVTRIRADMITSSHWLGIALMPIDEALKVQLKLDDRMMVQSVVPDSPAERAGVKKYDIVMKLGDRDIHSLEDLVKALADNKDKKTTLTVIREGEEKAISVQPEKRPEGDVTIQLDSDARRLEKSIEQWLQGKGGIWRPDGSLHLRFFGPGFEVGSSEKFPSGLAVTIEKHGDKPAEITVKQGDRTWSVTEETLDELPDDIRPHVERLMGRHRGAWYDLVPRGKLQLQPDLRALEPQRIQPRVVPRVEAVPRSDLKKLRKEMEKLREEMNQLKKQLDHPESQPE